MKIAACQFAVSGVIEHNLNIISKYAIEAAKHGARLVIFPECALTGYPPRSMPSASAVDFNRLDAAHRELQRISNENNIFILVGTILRVKGGFLNSAMLLDPNNTAKYYHKRALWGWDSDNFIPGDESGVFPLDELKIGVRICFEVRFPEYFRELYREDTHLNIVLFFDVCDEPNPDRYDLIKSHLRTRASENITPLLSVNAIRPYQTAPTAFFDRSGAISSELSPGKEGLLICDYPFNPLDFSESGRQFLSNSLCNAQ